jgi:hypothetical protein
MASKKSKSRRESSPSSNPGAVRIRILQIIFLALSIMVILAMILSAFATTS